MYTMLDIKKEIRINYAASHTKSRIVEEHLLKLSKLQASKENTSVALTSRTSLALIVRPCIPITSVERDWCVASSSRALLIWISAIVACGLRIAVMTRSIEFPVIRRSATTLHFYHDINGMLFLSETRNYETEHRK